MKHKHLRFLIEYIVPPEHVNMDEVLETLRQYGEADVIDITIVERRKGGEGGCFCDPSNDGPCEH